MEEGLPVPILTRIHIYHKLDPGSVLQMRLVNSRTLDEIDTIREFNLRINTRAVSPDALHNLFSLKVPSIKLLGSNSGGGHDDADGNGEGPDPLDYTLRNPFLVQTLEFGEKCPHPLWENEHLDKSFLDEHIVLELMKQCNENVQHLALYNVKLTGEPLLPERRGEFGDFGKKLVNLKTLSVHFVDEDKELRSLPLVASILTNCTSPELTSVSLGLVFGRDPQEDLEEHLLVPLIFSPFYTIFNLISRHWKTLRELTINMILFYQGNFTENLDWANNPNPNNELFQNLRKIQSLTKLYVNDHYFNEYEPTAIIDIFQNFILQQRALQSLESHMKSIIHYETLRQILQFNSHSLKSIIVTNLVKEWGHGQVGFENILDMDIFSRCSNLEEIDLTEELPFCFEDDTRTSFKVINLNRIPVQLKSLALVGVSFADIQIPQLYDLSERCVNLTKIQFGLEHLSTIVGLTSVVRNFLLKSESLNSINFRIEKHINAAAAPGQDNNDNGWNIEVPQLVAFFESLSSGTVDHDYRNHWGSSIDEDEVPNYHHHIPLREFYSFNAVDITPSDREIALNWEWEINA